VHTFLRNVADVLFWTCLTVSLYFIIGYAFPCKPVHSQCYMIPNGFVADRCRQFMCDEGFYSEVGALAFTTSDQVARVLFDRSLDLANDFNIAPLLIYGIVYWFLVSMVYGAAVPGGLFVPAIVVGGVYGRAFGILLSSALPWLHVNPGVYALLGAGSMLGGFTRLALPITIMLVEMTGDATYLLPIMITTFVAKLTADEFVPPLYPSHMKIEKIPVFGEKINPDVESLTAADVAVPVPALRTVMQLSQIVDVLYTNKSVMFPVQDLEGRFVGLVLRRNVFYALQHTDLYYSVDEAEQHQRAVREALAKGQLRK
jgi:chloride channel 7